jgi:hypothetical protein
MLFNQKKQFVAHLAKTLEDWQVKQADYAFLTRPA